MPPSISELFLYAAASAAALGVDIAVLAALVSLDGWPYLAASVVSFVAGGAFLYVLSIRYVFRFRRLPHLAIELPMFVALGTVGLGVNTAVMFAAVQGAHVQYLLAKLCAAACTFLVNFLLRRSVLFARLPQVD